MKKFFKSSLLLLVAAGTVFCSCAKKDPIEPQKGTFIEATPVELAFAAQSADVQNVTLTSDGEWMATAPEWITIDPLTGSGNATVTVSVKDNVDESGVLQGPRSGKITFALLDNGSVSATVNVNQEGDNELDTRHTYVKVDKVTSGKAYLVVAKAPNQNDALVIPVLFGDTGTYGYPKSVVVEANDDGSITLEDETSGLVFTEFEGGYTIQMYNSRYIWKQDGYKTWSCALLGEMPSEPYVWAVTPRIDGTFEITLNGGIMSYGTENYTTFSAYPAADEYTVYPFLYEDTKDVVLNTDYVSVNPKTQTVAATATEAEFAVSSNLSWTVTKNEGDWIRNFAESGSGDGKITVQFDANESEAERTAGFTVSSVDGAVKAEFTLVQSGVVSSFDTIADVQKSDDKEKTFNVKGTVAGVYARGCLITDGTGYILYYKNAAVDYVIGDELTVSGVVSAYGGFNQFTNAAIVEKVGHKDDFKHPDAVAFDNAAFQAWYDAEAKDVKYVSFEGVLAVDGNYYNITLEDGSKLIARLQYATIDNVDALNGHKVAAKGYTIGTTSYNGAPIVNVMMTSIEDKGAVVSVEVFINEIDTGGKKIEIYNATEVDVDIAGYALVRNAAVADFDPDKDKWVIPAGMGNIPAKGFAVYTAKSSEAAAGPLFGISGSKGFILELQNTKGNQVDLIANRPVEAEEAIVAIADGESYGRKTDGGDQWVLFSVPSIGQSNANGTVKPSATSEKTLAELNALATADGAAFEVTVKDVVVSYVNKGNAFIQDATAGTQIYLNNHGLTAGKKIDGVISGTVKLYNDYAEITALDYSAATLTDVTFTPETATIAQLLDNYSFYVNRLVKLQEVKVTDGIAKDDRNGKISQGDSEINLYASVNGVAIDTDAEGDLVCIPTLYRGAKQVGVYEDSFFTPTGGGPQPVTSEYSIDLAYTLGSSSDNVAATINGESVGKTLKIGTSSKVGDLTLTVPAGTKKITYYAIAWKGAATTLEFYEGETLLKSQEIAANDGATGNPPYTITVTETDKYVIEKEFATETQLKVTTAAGAKTRAILFGIKAE